jgi:hypothetical protein
MRSLESNLEIVVLGERDFRPATHHQVDLIVNDWLKVREINEIRTARNEGDENKGR